MTLDAKAIKKAEIRLSVARDIAQMNISILDSVSNIIGKASTIKNFTSYQEAVEKLPVENRRRFDWEVVTSNTLRNDFQSANQSINELKRIAREILNISLQFPNYVPHHLIEWANLTLDLDMKKLSQYLTENNEQGEGARYAKLLGIGLGQNVKNIRIFENSITK